MKSRLIVNPVSGTDSAPSRLTLMNERLREHVGAMDIVMTVAEGDAARAQLPPSAMAMITYSSPVATAR